MKNGKAARNSSSLIMLYGIIAVVFITAFQLYWLYSVYKSQEKVVTDEAQNILNEYVLNNDVVIFVGKMQSSESFVTDNIVNHVLVSPNAKIDVKVKVVGSNTGKLTDSLSVKLDSLFSPGTKKNAEKELFAEMKARFKKTLPGLTIKAYTKNSPVEGKVITAVSKINTSEERSITLLNLRATVLKKLWPSIALSLLYLIVCIGAVVLLINSIRKSRRLMEQKSNFTNNMTHELRTPLATLYAATEALDKYNVLDDKQAAKEYIQIMQADLKRLTDMAESILYNAKLSDGRIHLRTTDINLKELLRDITAKFRPRTEKLEAIIDYEKVPDDIFVKADEEHITKVFTNLIDNSLKYAAAKTIINIAADKDDDLIRIVVADNGIGIPHKHHKDIFKPYFRVSEGNIHTIKGYGLGLSYAKEIIMLHGGEIVLLNSEEEKGTAFGITIPAANG